VPLISLQFKDLLKFRSGNNPSLETATPGSTAYNLFGFGSTRPTGNSVLRTTSWVCQRTLFSATPHLNDQDDD